MFHRSAMSPVVATAVLTLVAVSSSVLAAPWRDELFQQRACGDQLANMLALVCEGRGYNMPFSQSHRKRRQIVDECCHHSCTPSMLALYCRPDLPETSTGTNIRKRSENHMESSEAHFGEDLPASQPNPSLLESLNAVEDNPLHDKPSPSKNHGPISLLPHLYNDMARNSVKPEPEDDQFYRKGGFPALRHHRTLLRSTRHYREQGPGRKPKRAKKLVGGSGEATKTFQIGAVKPYFAGRAMATRTNHILHGPFS